MSKKFSSLTTEECTGAYKEMLKNAKAQWSTGTSLAASGNFGNATSILIISIEEYIKALIILFDSQGFRFRNTKGVNTFFKNHQIRYVIAYTMFIMNIFGQDIIRLMISVKERPEKMLGLYREMIESEDLFEKKLKLYFLRKLVMIKKEFAWFSQVDVFRQEGFYCDYKDQLKSPLDIDIKVYTELYERLHKVREIAEFLILSFESKDTSVHASLEKLKTDFRKRNYYQKISHALAGLSASKQNPFEHLKSKIQKLVD